MHNFDARVLEQLLGAVGAHLEAAGTSVSVVIVGGAALALRGWVPRSTHDVDVLALASGVGGTQVLIPPVFPEELLDAVARVARDFDLSQDWFNAQVGAQWQTGLPENADQDLRWLRFGGLRVGLAGRHTLIALKLHTAADSDPASKHTQDLLALDPTDQELEAARAWVVGQDTLEELPRIVR